MSSKTFVSPAILKETVMLLQDITNGKEAQLLLHLALLLPADINVNY